MMSEHEHEWKFLEANDSILGIGALCAQSVCIKCGEEMSPGQAEAMLNEHAALQAEVKRYQSALYEEREKRAMSEHTQTPWYVGAKNTVWRRCVDDKNRVVKQPICDADWPALLSPEERAANAEFIVEACNSYDALLADYERRKAKS
jgi:hypothetical protein